MRYLNTNDIEMWSNSVDCQYHLPHLIRKLILATADQTKIRSIQFPYGEDVQVGGYDGDFQQKLVIFLFLMEKVCGVWYNQ
jgi:hypothetical protein